VGSVFARARIGVALAAALGLGALAACGDETFRCEDSTQCVVSGEQGVCEANGYCTFDDADCACGRRYGEQAGQGLAGACLEQCTGETNTGTQSSGSTTATTASGTTTSGTSTTTSDASSTTGPNEDPYGPCADGTPCFYAAASCFGQDGDMARVCAPRCGTMSCPDPLGGSPSPTCDFGLCVLECQTVNDCPDGMQCSADLGGINPVCGWAID
jgi:hypothetical protein